MHLTKSDFKVARTCPTKLYYKKRRYPSLLDDDPYMAFLADGGYMVETMAKLLYPDGREIGSWDKPEQAFAATQAALAQGNCTLFEATIIHGNFLARIDILQKFGKTLRLIEVKSTSIDTAKSEDPLRGKKGGITSKYQEYLEDVTFQAVVLGRAFPDYSVVPYLCVVDKAKTATVNATFDKFTLKPRKTAQLRPEVIYTGNVKRLAKEHVLAILNVTDFVKELREEIETSADQFAESLKPNPPRRIAPEIGKKCKKCEYRMPPEGTGKSGFAECWGRLATVTPHVLDLYYVGYAGGRSNDLVGELARQGRADLASIEDGMLRGAYGVRQRLQIKYTARNEEFIDPELKRILSRHRYPLHFIDFEASQLAIPYHVDMQPYERAAFQWSCHTIRSANGEVEHREWLNAEEVFPNFEFARTLREAIGDSGTVYIWSPYERTTLKDVREQMDKYGEKDAGLKKWLEGMIPKDNKRVVDLCKLALQYYFHPLMKGRLSIKYVLPAAWTSNSAIQQDPLFTRYVKRDAAGNLLNPYAALPPLPVGDDEEVVAEGTGAIRAYQEMMFGLSATNPNTRANYRQLLLQYCELDTAAMVMIWKHWVESSS